MSPSDPSGRTHADDLISAHLDGELDDATARWVEDHLGACAGCRQAAEEAALARSWVRGLPDVDGSPAVQRFLARHRAVIRTGAAFVGAAAVALAALALTSAVLHPDVLPPVDLLTDTHRVAARAGTTGEDMRAALDEAGAEMAGMRPVAGVGRPYSAPPALLGQTRAGGLSRLQRHMVLDGDDLTLVVYRDGGAAVSVFEQPGRLEWDRLRGGDVESIGERRVWVRRGSPVVMVTEVGDVVVTVVSEDPAAATTALGGLPEERRGSTMDRLHDACIRFTQTFAAGG